MIFIWGFRLFGKVDEVPGMFHVATKFFHVWYIPLIPAGSHVVLAKSANGFRGVPISLSPKSILLAWLRAAFIVAAIFVGIISVTTFTHATEYAAHQTYGAPAGGAGVPPQTSQGAGTTNHADLVFFYVLATIEAVISLGLLGFTILLWKLRPVRRASYERAMKICELIKINDEGRIHVERIYGRITPEQAKAELEAIAKDREELAQLEAEAVAADTPAQG